MYENIDIDTTDGSSSSGRGAKGSIRDRLISIMLRKRYEKLKLQKDFYTKDNLEKKIDYIRTLKDFQVENVSKLDDQDKEVIRNLKFTIPVLPITRKQHHINIPTVGGENENINELHEVSEELANSNPIYELDGREISVDPETEQFDFNEYDYYEVEEIKRGMDIKDLKDSEKEIVDIDKEEKLAKDEKVIVEEITTFIDKSLETLSEIKEEIKVIKDEVSKPYTLEQAQDLERRYLELRAKVEKLKKQFDTVKYKYDFSDFAILESISIMDSIEDYRDNAQLENVEMMVDVCKNEIDKIDGIIIENENIIKVGSDVEEKKEEIVGRTIAFEKNKEKTEKVETLEDKVAYELNEQKEILKSIRSRVDKIEEVKIPQVSITGYGRIFASFLRIAAGILTTPISNRRIFGIALGTSLINRGLRGLRQGLNVEERTETVLKYEDLEREIINCKDKIGLTNILLLDSIDQIEHIRKEFKDKFEAYIYVIPEYNDALNKIDKLQKQLEQKKKEIDIINKDLDLQYEKNKVKMRKVKNHNK